MSRKSCGRKAMRKHRGYILKALAAIVTAVLLPVTVSAHGGRTDSQGGHNSPDGYHYHHGYPAHQHDGGHCPYNFDDKTNHSGSSKDTKKAETSAKSGSSGNNAVAQENVRSVESSLREDLISRNDELIKQIKYKERFKVVVVIMSGATIILLFLLRSRNNSIESLKKSRSEALIDNQYLKNEIRQTQKKMLQAEKNARIAEDILRQKLCIVETREANERLQLKMAERTILSLKSRLAEAEQKKALPSHADVEADENIQKLRIQIFRDNICHWLEAPENLSAQGTVTQQLALSRFTKASKFTRFNGHEFVEVKKTNDEISRDRQGYRDYLSFCGAHAGVGYPRVKCKHLQDKRQVYYLPFDPEYNNIAMKKEFGDTYVNRISEAEHLGYSPAIDLAENRVNDER